MRNCERAVAWLSLRRENKYRMIYLERKILCYAVHANELWVYNCNLQKADRILFDSEWKSLSVSTRCYAASEAISLAINTEHV